MKLEVVFENERILVLDKPAGLVVNRSTTIKEETLQDQIAQYLQLSAGDLGIGDRAGIVHRLDRETSGLLVVAKAQKAFENLQEQFASRLVKKDYLALVHGAVREESGVIEVSLKRIGKFGKIGVAKGREEGGRETRTDYQIIQRLKFKENKFEKLIDTGYSKARISYFKKRATAFTYLRVSPQTGRTHQIRVALKHLGHPVVSDLIYTPSKLLKFDLSWCRRLFLHAARLEFSDPASDKRISFGADLPNELKDAMLNLEEL